MLKKNKIKKTYLLKNKNLIIKFTFKQIKVKNFHYLTLYIQ